MRQKISTLLMIALISGFTNVMASSINCGTNHEEEGDTLKVELPGKTEKQADLIHFGPFTFKSVKEEGLRPIEFISIDVERSEDTVTMKWNTASEKDNDYFIIERSRNGIDFKEVGKIPGAGNSQNIVAYQFVDEDPLSGPIFYRLKQTSKDGRFTYGPIKQIASE